MKEVKTLSEPSLRRTRKSLKETAKLPFISAVITLLCFIAMLIASQKYPLGKYTVVISDLEAQYAPYLFLLKSKLTGLNFDRFFSDFGYSFLLGAGKGMAGTFGYYLASPLNLLVLFFDSYQVNELVMTLMAIRLSLAAAFMTLFIRERSEDQNSKWPVLWGIMYAFSSYTMLFLFHIMWLDGYLLLPLLLYMIERYLKNGKLGGVTAVLLLLFVSNYYIAYMAGLYSFFYLLARMYVLGRFTKENKPIETVGRFILRAVFSGLTLGIMLLPVGLDTLRNGDPTASDLKETYVGFTFTRFLDRIFMGYPGDFSEVLISNMPLIFVSLLVTLLCVVYFVSKSTTGKQKKLYATAFVLAYISLCINFVDVAWQVFDSPNWFWHRESFVFITLFLTVAYKAFEKLKEITREEIYKSLGILIVLLLAAHSFGDMREEGKLLIYNAAGLVIFAMILIGMKKSDWSGQLKNMGKILPSLLAVLVVYETSFLAPMLSSGTATLSVYTDEGDKYADHILSFEDCAIASDNIHNGFRSEYDSLRASDDVYVGGAPQYANYRSITLFNSNSNKAFGRFLKQLGYTVNYNYFASGHSYSAPSADAFFSIGSLYATGDYSYADFLAEDENITFLKNRSVLPLVFTVRSDANDFDFYSLESASEDKNYFEFQNDWYRSMFASFNEDFFIPVESGIEEEIINGSAIDLNDYQMPDEEISDELQSEDESSDKFDPDELGVEDLVDYGDSVITVYRINQSLPIILNYDITVPNSEELYMNISVPRTNSGSDVYLNGSIIASYSPGTFYSSILRLGSYEPGETVRVSVCADRDSFVYMDINFAYFDIDKFESQFEGVDMDNVSVNEADDGYISFGADVADGQMILTSIPYEEGWEAYVDGLLTSITPYQDALIGLEVPSGYHDVVLKYNPPGLKAGALLSAVGVAGLIVTFLTDKKRYNNGSKKQLAEENV